MPPSALHEFAARSTEEVFEDHLRLRVENQLEEDLARNYAEDVILLTVNSNACGHDAIRMSAARLADQLPEPRFEFIAEQVRDRFALLIWRATSDRFDAIVGADSFVIEGGLIRLQTIHYRLENERTP
ncbi:MAG: nuclear transport factor 2 family protein [Pseudomonadota bacterium]|nr:nuclear transport factor 2 family protein [Pseudomonadota bacterium]